MDYIPTSDFHSRGPADKLVRSSLTVDFVVYEQLSEMLISFVNLTGGVKSAKMVT